MLAKFSWPILTALIFLLACAPKPAPVTTGAKEPVEIVAVPSPKEGWEAEWERIVKEAKREGKVVLYGPPIAETRTGFVEGFQKAYPGIVLEYIGLSGAQTAPKLIAERRAGIYQVDIHVGGTTTILSALKEFALPVKPLLLLPAVKDPKAWYEGKIDFSDDAEALNPVFTINADTKVVYNPNLVDGQKLEGASYWEFTRLEWKEKIIMRDPRIAGGGLSQATFWYLAPGLGVDFIKALAANKVTLSRDPRLSAEQVARGRYSILLVPDVGTLKELQEAGAPLKQLENIKEGAYITPSFGSTIAVDRAPHPKAAVVFLNWLLGKEGQTVWTRTSGYPSRRLDAPTDHLPTVMLPKPGISYIPLYKEKYVNLKDEVIPVLNSIFAGF